MPRVFTKVDPQQGNAATVQVVGKGMVESTAEGRDLTMGEFIKIAYAIGKDAHVDAALSAMPTLQALLLQYQSYQGIRFADLDAPGATLNVALAKVIDKGHLTPTDKTAFKAKWVELYPNMVPEQ